LDIVAAGGKTFYRVVRPMSIGLLYALRTALFLLLALGHDGGAEAATKVFGQFVKLGVAIDLDGFLGGVANYIAVVAPGEMVLEFDFCLLVENAIQIVR
jgi:hypothetical protein